MHRTGSRVLRAAPNGATQRNTQTLYGRVKGRKPPGFRLAVRGISGARYKKQGRF